MMEPDSFDHRPDPAVGGLLREHLRASDDAAFVVRMRAAARQAGLTRRTPHRLRGPAEWDSLDGWFRPGIAAPAAVLVGVLVSVGIARGAPSSVSLADAIRPAEAPAELFDGTAPPDPQLLLSPLLEAR